MIRKYIKQLMPLLVLAVLLSVQLGAASERLPSSVLACWPMDDPIYPHATLTDAGPNQFDLTLWEGELATGRFGGALLVCAEADAYRSDILRSLAMARQHNPLVRLRDGRWVPHYPTHIYRRGRDLGWIRETLEGSVNLLLCGILDPNGPEARGILDDFQDNLYTGGEFGYPIPDFHEMWYDWAGFSCQPNLLAGLMPYLDRDEIEVYVWMFFNAFTAAYSPKIQGVVEHPRPVLGFSNSEPFKTSDESNSIKWLRYMFVYGKGDTLHLGKAVPREWLNRKESIHLKRVHTRFGVVSVEYQADPRLDRITCQADLALTVAPARTLVRFRHPDKKPISSVRVNGVDHKAFDPSRGDVDISGKSGPVKIEAVY